MKRFGSFFFLLIFCSSLVYSQNQENKTENNNILHVDDITRYNIKNRLNIKASVSLHRSNEKDFPFIEFGEGTPSVYKPRFNARVDCNYGVSKWLELGAYIGFMRHRASSYQVIDLENGIVDAFTEIAYAPTFGINANVHLLPFWVKNKNCRWELYLTAKYGGTYLVKWYGHRVGNRQYAANAAWIDDPFNPPSTIYIDTTHYRHEFGAGIGGGVYFWNVFGLYFEALAGKFSYFQDMKKSPYTIRIGAEVKFTPKRKRLKM